MLEQVKILLGVDGTELDGKLAAIITTTEQRLKLLLGGVDQIPDSLEYIVTEVAVIRFNRIGSEGVSSHSVEGESLSFVDDDFAAYREDIQAYLNAQGESAVGRVRFL